MLHFSHISKAYTNGGYLNKVLDDVEISINDNDISLIIGKSGVGKSTLLNIIGCLIKPNKGTVCYNDKVIDLVNGDIIGLDGWEESQTEFGLDVYYLQKNRLDPG